MSQRVIGIMARMMRNGWASIPSTNDNYLLFTKNGEELSVSIIEPITPECCRDHHHPTFTPNRPFMQPDFS
jgi:hypothetical protein